MKIFLASTGSSAATRGLVIGLGALALTAFLVGNHSYASRLEARARAQASASAVKVRPGEDFYYFRSGQWLADLRTLVNVCRYMADPDLA